MWLYLSVFLLTISLVLKKRAYEKYIKEQEQKKAKRNQTKKSV